VADIDEMSALLRLVAIGLGIAIVPKTAATAITAGIAVVAIRPSAPLPIQMLHRTDASKPGLLRFVALARPAAAG
jgi:DNA-binding transcriptional LysR family regulator